MKKIVLLLNLIIFVLISCTEGCNVKGIEVSQEIIDGGNMNGIDYCFLYKKALDGDSSSIKDFSTIETFEGGFIYAHGVYLIRLIDRVGDDYYVKTIKGINNRQKALIDSYINAGMDIYETYYTGNGAKKYKSISDFWNKHPILKDEVSE